MAAVFQTVGMRKPPIMRIFPSAAPYARGGQHCLSPMHVARMRPGEVAKRGASTTTLELQHKVRHTSWS
jgi:hypothetical protein